MTRQISTRSSLELEAAAGQRDGRRPCPRGSRRGGGRTNAATRPGSTPTQVGREVKLSIRGGADAKPIDVSETGVLAETTSRLRPGGVVELLLQIDGVRSNLRATIVRSVVHSLGPTVFRTAFKFEERTKLPERK